VFGPLAVRPDHWDRGVGRLLLEACLPLFEQPEITHAALFTRIEPKNIHLYSQHGFWPGSLTAITAKQVDSPPGAPPAFRTFAELKATETALADCRRITDALHSGLDLEQEIRAVSEQGLGDTIFVGEEDAPAGIAVCHVGEGSEAGPGACYVKFAAVTSGEGAAGRFGLLLDACEAYAGGRGLTRLVTGINMGREHASRMVLDRGFRTLALGAAMHRPNEPAWDRSGAYVLDDRR
jgi:GNAT superfamily N-acetyltransferase